VQSDGQEKVFDEEKVEYREVLMRKNAGQSRRRCMCLIVPVVLLMSIAICITYMHYPVLNGCDTTPPYLLVTSHNNRNAHKFTRDGCLLTQNALWGGDSGSRGGLRSIKVGKYLGNRALYVADSGKMKSQNQQSKIQVFGECTWYSHFRSYLTTAYTTGDYHWKAPPGSHSYGLAFDGDGNLYSSFQHTDNILRFEKDTFKPMALPQYLSEKVANGTFKDHPLPEGSFFQFGRPGVHASSQTGIRSIVWVDDLLWVANEDYNKVYMVNEAGFIVDVISIKKPIGVYMNEEDDPATRLVYIGSKDQHHKNSAGVYAFSPQNRTLVKHYMSRQLAHPTGIVTHAGTLYVADQINSELFLFDIATEKHIKTVRIHSDLKGPIEQIALSDC